MARDETALIVGAGSGLSASLARALAAEGVRVALAARNPGKLEALARETGAIALACDAVDRAQVEAALAAVESKWSTPDLVVYNASYRSRGPLVELDPSEVKRALEVTAYGGFLVAQAAAKRMLASDRSAAQGAARQSGAGAIFFTGASASVKGYPESAPFAMGKFALRGLAQSMARELHPQGIHIGHVVIDGGIRSARRPPDPGNPDALLAPDAIAQSYWRLIEQPRSGWSWEIEVRPWVEEF